MNETTATTAAPKAEDSKRILAYRETTPEKAAQAAYYLLDAIRDTAESMEKTVDTQPSNPAEIDASDLLVDLAGWAAKIITLSELAQSEVFQLMS